MVKHKLNTVYLSLGSNIGHRKNNIIKALKLIQKNVASRILKVSSVYLTSPIGPKQNDFYNAVVKIKTNLSSNNLLSAIKNIERSIGRKKSNVRWSPRIIDIDILFYNDTVLNTDNLIIPHPELNKRLFVLEPLNEIAPNLVHPLHNEKIKTIRQKLLLTSHNQKVKMIVRNGKLWTK